MFDPEIRLLFRRISYSIGIAFSWLAITCIAAISGDNAFIVGEIRLANILFYIWFVISVVILVMVLRKLWTGKDEPAGEELIP